MARKPRLDLNRSAEYEEQKRREEHINNKTAEAVGNINQDIFEMIASQEGPQYINYKEDGKTKIDKIPTQCEWKKIKFSYSYIKQLDEFGMVPSDGVVKAQGMRVFEQMGYSIETSMDFQKKYGKLISQNGLICISDSTQIDNRTGRIIHDTNTKSIYIALKKNGIFVIEPEKEESKYKSFEEVAEAIERLSYRGGGIRLSAEEAENAETTPTKILYSKIGKRLEGIDPGFLDLWESITNIDYEKMTNLLKREIQKDSYKQLSKVMDKQVSTEGTKKGKGFLGKIFGRNKDKDKETEQ